MRRALLVALVLMGAAHAQEKPKDGPRPEQFVELGFKFRRDGSFDAAAAAFDEALKKLPERSDERRAVLLDDYDVACVQSKFDRAARLVRGFEVALEVRALLRASKAEAGLEAARAAHDFFAEGLALRALGRDEDALVALGKGGTPGFTERADYLVALGHFDAAAKDFEVVGDVFGKTRALERAGSPAADWEAARGELRKKLEALIAKGAEAKSRLASAQGLVAKDRARFALAETHGELSKEYERFSYVHERLKERDKAAKLAQLALDFAAEQAKVLSDGGKDKYGEARAAYLGLDARQSALRERVKALR